jgi:hypothetical protein
MNKSKRSWKNESIRRESAETMQRTKELLQRIEAHRQ